MEDLVRILSNLRRIAEISDDDFHRSLIFADVWLWRDIVVFIEMVKNLFDLWTSFCREKVNFLVDHKLKSKHVIGIDFCSYSLMSSFPLLKTLDAWKTLKDQILFTHLKYHHRCSSVPLSVCIIRTSLVSCLFWFRPQERPMFAMKSTSIFSKFNRILTTFFCIVAFSTRNFIEHWHEDDSIGDVLRITLFSFHKFLSEFQGRYFSSWILRRFSTRIPSAYHRYDSIPWSDCSPNIIKFYSCKLRLGHLSSLPYKVLRRRRCTHKRWRSEKLCRTISLSFSM